MVRREHICAEVNFMQYVAKHSSFLPGDYATYYASDINHWFTLHRQRRAYINRTAIYFEFTWIGWHHQMVAFSALLALCVGNSPVTGEFPSQRPVTQSFDVFFDLRLNKGFSKQWRRWRFETPLRLLWRHCNGLFCQPTFSSCGRPITVRCWGM